MCYECVWVCICSTHVYMKVHVLLCTLCHIPLSQGVSLNLELDWQSILGSQPPPQSVEGFQCHWAWSYSICAVFCVSSECVCVCMFMCMCKNVWMCVCVWVSLPVQISLVWTGHGWMLSCDFSPSSFLNEVMLLLLNVLYGQLKWWERRGPGDLVSLWMAAQFSLSLFEFILHPGYLSWCLFLNHWGVISEMEKYGFSIYIDPSFLCSCSQAPCSWPQFIAF